jgi:hypothetical protein
MRLNREDIRSTATVDRSCNHYLLRIPFVRLCSHTVEVRYALYAVAPLLAIPAITIGSAWLAACRLLQGVSARWPTATGARVVARCVGRHAVGAVMLCTSFSIFRSLIILVRFLADSKRKPPCYRLSDEFIRLFRRGTGVVRFRALFSSGNQL